MNQPINTSEIPKADVQIFHTKDYSLFHFLKGNRHLNQQKIKKIISSVENGLSFFQYCPIMVNNNGYVIDGQHRFHVCQKLGLELYFVIVPNFTLRQVAEMNNNASKWRDQDYLNCYIDIGINHYCELENFINKYQVNLGIAASLLAEGKVRASGVIDDFREGLFKVSYLISAENFMDKVILFGSLCPTYKSRNFMQALETLLTNNQFYLDDFFAKLNKHNLVIEQKGSAKEYLTHMEDLFNYHNQKRIRIY